MSDKDIVVEQVCEGCPPVGYATDKTRCVPCPRQFQTSTDATVEDWQQALANAFEAGCRAVHDNYQEDRDPDFTEASLDYAKSVVSIAALQSHSPRADAAEARVTELEGALAKIDAIRNSIIGFQKINWSEHIYPLVAALDEVGIEGKGYGEARADAGTLIEQIKAAEAERDKLRELATANNTLARMNGEHRDQWRNKAVLAMEALAQWKCGSCGGSGIYKNKRHNTEDDEFVEEELSCKVCDESGLNPIARQALASITDEKSAESGRA